MLASIPENASGDITTTTNCDDEIRLELGKNLWCCGLAQLVHLLKCLSAMCSAQLFVRRSSCDYPPEITAARFLELINVKGGRDNYLVVGDIEFLDHSEIR